MPRAVLIALNVAGLAVWLPVAPILLFVAYTSVYGRGSAGDIVVGLAAVLVPTMLWLGATLVSWRLWRRGRHGWAIAVELVPLIPGAFFAWLAMGRVPRLA